MKLLTKIISVLLISIYTTNIAGAFDLFFNNNNKILKNNIIYNLNHDKKDYLYKYLLSDYKYTEDEEYTYRLYLEVYDYLNLLNRNNIYIEDNINKQKLLKKVDKEITLAMSRYEKKENAEKEYADIVQKLSGYTNSGNKDYKGNIFINEKKGKICGYSPVFKDLDITISNTKNVMLNNYFLYVYNPYKILDNKKLNIINIKDLKEIENENIAIISIDKIKRNKQGDIFFSINKKDITKYFLLEKDEKKIILNFTFLGTDSKGNVSLLTNNVATHTFPLLENTNEKENIQKACNKKFDIKTFNERKGKVILKHNKDLFLGLDKKYGLNTLNNCISSCDNYDFDSCVYTCEEKNKTNLTNYAKLLLKYDNILKDKIIKYMKTYNFLFKKSVNNIVTNNSKIETLRYKIMLLKGLKLSTGERIDGVLYKYLEPSDF